MLFAHITILATSSSSAAAATTSITTTGVNKEEGDQAVAQLSKIDTSFCVLCISAFMAARKKKV